MLIMALKPPVVSEQLRSLDHDDAVLAHSRCRATGFLTDFFVLGSFRGLP